MNNIAIAGRIGRDIEIRHISSGDAVGSFTIADDQGRDRPTIWWRCQLWGKRAESLAPYLVKGASVTITGQVQEREYTDKEGQQRKSQEIRVIDVAMQGGRQDRHAPAHSPRPAATSRAEPPAVGGGIDDMDDDIPF